MPFFAANFDFVRPTFYYNVYHKPVAPVPDVLYWYSNTPIEVTKTRKTTKRSDPLILVIPGCRTIATKSLAI
eukprot:512201-Rhodomonas_salina.5